MLRIQTHLYVHGQCSCSVMLTSMYTAVVDLTVSLNDTLAAPKSVIIKHVSIFT